MKIWKLVSGILSIIFSVIVFFQSMLVGTANTLSSNGEVSGSAGLFVSVFMLAGGIISIVIRNSEKIAGNVALSILFGLASCLGFSMAGSYSDLNIWAGWCLINMVLVVFSIIKLRKKVD